MRVIPQDCSKSIPIDSYSIEIRQKWRLFNRKTAPYEILAFPVGEDEYDCILLGEYNCREVADMMLNDFHIAYANGVPVFDFRNGG